MKKLLFINTVLACLTFQLFSQTPQSFNYQAVVRDNLGAVIENQNVGIKIDILQTTASGTLVYSESHSVITNQFGLVNLQIGTGTILSGDFAAINWGADIYFIQIELDPLGGTAYQLMGVSQLLTVPYAMFAQSSADSSLWEQNGSDIYYNQGNVGIGAISPNGKLLVQSNASAGVNDDIFSVLNANGDTVFAVYQEGVRIFVDDNGGTKANGSRGGFAVGGFNPTKAGFTNEYLRVTPDSVRVYINDDFVGTKANGSRGGFAVGGFNPAKGSITDDYFFVQDDSTRIWTDGNGGFEILDLATGSTNYLDLTPENYFIGHESGDLITSGQFNSTLGYQSGYSILTGNDNSFIGYQSGYNTIQGSGNLFMGYQTGYTNTTGNFNSFLGYKSGYSNLGGVNNSFLGSFAGYSNTTGNYNTFVGDSTGYNNSIGSENSFYGDKAGLNNTDGSNNIFIGNLAGYLNTGGDSCIFIGNRSGYSNSSGESNVFVGNRSGYSNTSGDFNAFTGFKAGYSNTSGNYNVFMGYRAGYLNYNAYEGVFIGYLAGHNNYNGQRNVFIGSNAGYSNLSGFDNVFLGSSAGYDNTNGQYNVFLGASAGRANIDGDANVFIGQNTGRSNTVGYNNVFLGTSSGFLNTVGYRNVFIGMAAGYTNTGGTSNVFIGNQAGYDNSAGHENVFLGAYAGGNNTYGGRNVFIGVQAGWQNTTGNYNVYIGNKAGVSSMTGAFNVFLGDSAGYFETASNKLYIENSNADSTGAIIWGDFANDKLRLNADVGLSRNAVTNALEVEGNASKTTAGSWLANSDKRIKTDIQDIDNAIELLMMLRPVKFKYTDEWMKKHPTIEDKHYYNFIAQEYQQVFPKSVKGSGEYLDFDKKEILQIDTYNAQIITIKAAQDLIKENREQQRLIEDLKKENDFLKSEYTQITESNKKMNNRLEKIEAILNSSAKK